MSTLTMTQRAEQALLGALLRKPWQMVVLEETILPEEFADSRLARVYNAMVGRWGSIEPEAIRGNLTEIAASAKVSPGYLEELQKACPAPLHGGAYATLVAQAAARRGIRAVADNLASRGVAAGYGALAGHDLMVAEAIRQNSARFNPDTMTAVLTKPGTARDTRQEAAEECVLSAILTQHRETGHMLATLRPEAFADPARREMYEAIVALAASHREIDPLTVDWEISCRRERNQQPGGRTPAESAGPSYSTRLTGTPVTENPARVADALAATAAQADRSRRRRAPAARTPAESAAPQPVTGPSPAQPHQSPLLQLPPSQAPGNGHVPGQRM